MAHFRTFTKVFALVVAVFVALISSKLASDPAEYFKITLLSSFDRAKTPTHLRPCDYLQIEPIEGKLIRVIALRDIPA